jgi:hypothetical protein
MKDFREAAEKRYPDLPYTPKNDEPMYSPHSARLFEQDRFVEGAKHGYSEAMKEHREFYHKVREMLVSFNKSSLTSAMVNLNDTHVVEFCSHKYDVLKKLKSFTDHEQSELPFKD